MGECCMREGEDFLYCVFVYVYRFFFKIKIELEIRVFIFFIYMAGCVVRMAFRKRLAFYVLEEEGKIYIVGVDLTRVVGVILMRKFLIIFLVVFFL